MRIRIPHNFEPRAYQLPLLAAMDEGVNRAVAVWHRRSGKDKTLVNLTTKKAFERKGIYYYLLPTYSQARKIVWDGIDKAGFRFMDHFPESIVKAKNGTEMKVELINGSLFQLIGTDRYDSIMGTNPVGCVFSEYSLQDPRAWDYIRPILMENGGWAVFNYTPRGHNHGYDLYEMAKRNPNWFCQCLTVKDTGAVSVEDIQAERDAGMSEDMIQQEFYCSFEAAIPGAYYASELRRAREQGRITKVPYQSGIPVDTWWDLGIDDSTTIWFSQDVGREIHCIDYYEGSGEGLEHYVGVLNDKRSLWGCVYGRHVAPHDITVRELGTGKTRLATAKSLGISFDIAQRPAKKEDGIQSVRNIFSVLWFDGEHCEHGLNCLASYHSEYDEKNKIRKTTPVHNWASHGADALQTLAVAHKFTALKNNANKQRVLRPSSSGWMGS